MEVSDEMVEAAQGPSRELDAEIAFSVGWTIAHGQWWTPEQAASARKRGGALLNTGEPVPDQPRYTANIDAALTLVPSGWMVELWLAQPTETQQWHANANVYYERRKASRGEGATPALALCIAALRARGEG